MSERNRTTVTYPGISQSKKVDQGKQKYLHSQVGLDCWAAEELLVDDVGERRDL